eukprot:403363807
MVNHQKFIMKLQVSRGTDFKNWAQATNIRDLETDLAMLVGNLPAQYEDAKELMEKAQQVAGEGVDIQVTGHSLGGALSQMLAVGYGSEAITFNAYNIREILNDLTHFTEEQKNAKLERLGTINTQLEVMGTPVGEANINLRNQLWEEKNTINKQLVEDELYHEWKANGEENIVNYRITGDAVSSYVKLPNVGERNFKQKPKMFLFLEVRARMKHY